MKFQKLFLSVLALMLVPGLALAAPYASLIEVSPPSIRVGGDLDISYVLNQVADSVTIEILDSGSSVVASFAGIASPTGEVTVEWDGTVDNAGGAAVPEGADYTVRITCDVTVGSASWEEFASNRSLGAFGPPTKLETIFNGYSGKDFLISHDTSSDLFGLVIALSSYNAGTFPPEHGAAVVFKSNLELVDGATDGYATRVLKHPDDPDICNTQATWAGDWDPDNPDGTWVAGQCEINIMYATNESGLDEWLTDRDTTPDEWSLYDYPRSIAVTNVGAQKTAYIAHYSEALTRIEIDANNNYVAGSRVDVIGGANTTADLFAGAGITTNFSGTRYSKDVEFDSNNNVYWFSRQDGDGGALEDPTLYRFDAAVIEAATAGEIAEGSASWLVEINWGTDNDGKGVTIDPDGDVYVATDQGIYYAGNTATASNLSSLSTSDRLVDFTTIGAGWNPSDFGTNLAADYAGNLYVTDTSNEQLRGFAPPGASSVAVQAPSSQTFDIVAITGLDNWSDFK